MEPSKPITVSRSAKLLLGVLAFFLALFVGISPADEIHTGDAYAVMAGYLRALPAYVTWPTNTFTLPQDPWQVGILGPDPFGNRLEEVLHARQAAGRSFQIHRAASLKDLPDCEIIFVAIKDEDELKKVLAGLNSRPVLTVGDSKHFLDCGGIIQLQVQGTIRMSINLDSAREAHLSVPTKMLELAAEVIENGVHKQLK
jgi:hypothetical protein